MSAQSKSSGPQWKRIKRIANGFREDQADSAPLV